MQTIILAIFLGYGLGYDGFDDGKVYFHLSTPKKDYGFVAQNIEPYIYCDVISIKGK